MTYDDVFRSVIKTEIVPFHALIRSELPSPAKVVADAGCRNIIDAALELLRTYGWIQQKDGSPEVGMCIMGANRVACAVWSALHGVPVYYASETKCECNAIAEFEHEKGSHVPTWNDNPSRTFADVEKVLIRASELFELKR